MIDQVARKAEYASRNYTLAQAQAVLDKAQAKADELGAAFSAARKIEARGGASSWPAQQTWMEQADKVSDFIGAYPQYF